MQIYAKRLSLVAGVLLLIILATQLAFGGVAFGSTLTVDSTCDTVDAVPGDGVCADASGTVPCEQLSWKRMLMVAQTRSSCHQGPTC